MKILTKGAKETGEDVSVVSGPVETSSDTVTVFIKLLDGDITFNGIPTDDANGILTALGAKLDISYTMDHTGQRIFVPYHAVVQAQINPDLIGVVK